MKIMSSSVTPRKVKGKNCRVYLLLKLTYVAMISIFETMIAMAIINMMAACVNVSRLTISSASSSLSLRMIIVASRPRNMARIHTNFIIIKYMCKYIRSNPTTADTDLRADETRSQTIKTRIFYRTILIWNNKIHSLTPTKFFKWYKSVF